MLFNDVATIKEDIKKILIYQRDFKGEIKEELGCLKTKSKIWGAIGGMIPFITGILLYLVTTIVK